MARYKNTTDINTGVTTKVEISGNELTELQTRESAWDSKANKLKEIKFNRLQCLQQTDYLANSDVTMPDNIKTWRQSLRDIPSNHTDEDAYDLLLARDSDGNLTHSIWSKP